MWQPARLELGAWELAWAELAREYDPPGSSADVALAARLQPDAGLSVFSGAAAQLRAQASASGYSVYSVWAEPRLRAQVQAQAMALHCSDAQAQLAADVHADVGLGVYEQAHAWLRAVCEAHPLNDSDAHATLAVVVDAQAGAAVSAQAQAQACAQVQAVSYAVASVQAQIHAVAQAQAVGYAAVNCDAQVVLRAVFEPHVSLRYLTLPPGYDAALRPFEPRQIERPFEGRSAEDYR
ncbi:hypothetical protein [Vandammella animalimorsus]|uniref:hypothetical protein n=1 Tax=Vandammella animalimorsus TaxID=2029117 RepID=UPI0011777A6F|nr:hypothetical protein [Vandammella animalimorsus]